MKANKEDILAFIDKYCDVETKVKQDFEDTPPIECQVIYMNGLYISDMRCIEKGFYHPFEILVDNMVTEQIGTTYESVANYGFSPSQNKWFGWSHRAYYGFTIGSECTKGCVHYVPSTVKDYAEKMLDFWKDDGYDTYKIVGDTIEVSSSNNDKFCVLRDINNIVLGRGEWVAKTMEDAKEMAMTYANNIG